MFFLFLYKKIKIKNYVFLNKKKEDAERLKTFLLFLFFTLKEMQIQHFMLLNNPFNRSLTQETPLSVYILIDNESTSLICKFLRIKLVYQQTRNINSKKI